MPKKHLFMESEHSEVVGLMDQIEDAKLFKKLQVVRLRMENYRNPEIAAITKYSASRVSSLVTAYIREGLSYFREENRKGGNRRNVSFAEEAELLAKFQEAAEKGVLVTVEEIRAAYDQLIGHQSAHGTIYKILKRHKWRKLMPRSRHPKKASAEAIEASKKLTMNTRK